MSRAAAILSRAPRSFASVLLTLTLGCASTSPAPAFRDTALLVEARTGLGLTWTREGSEHIAVEGRTREFLEHELTASTAVQVALLRNQNLQATYEELSVTRADLVQAGLLANPSVGGAVVFPVAGAAQTGGTVSIVQDFVSIFTLAARKRVAGAALEAAKYRVAHAALELMYDVQAAFFALQAAQQIGAMRRAVLEAGDAALDLARRQHDAGNISDLDAASQEALYEQLKADAARSDMETVAARAKLTSLLGLWGPDAGFRVGTRLPDLPGDAITFEHLEALAVRRRLDLLAAREEAQAIANSLAQAKNFRWLGGAAAGASYERAPEGFSVAGPSASITLPIFDQGQATIARLEGELYAALARSAALAVEIRAQVRAAEARVVATRRLAERYTSVVVPLRRRIVLLAQEHYNAMLLGSYQLVQAKQSELGGFREAIEALRDYWIARAELERAAGGALVETEAPAPHSRGGT
jgi:cobalt-zinc-cadmium efflux system outer membrane protein